MPEPTGRMGRGSSHWDPVEQADRIRLLSSQRSADAVLTQWLRGKHIKDTDWEHDEFSGRSYEVDAGTIIEPVETRKREDMEIVPLLLIEEHFT